MVKHSADIAIIGAGIAGIATAYYLAQSSQQKILLIDPRQPMSYTSAQSGDNYRNWWPHRTMTDFTNDSIDELDRHAADSDNIFNLSRGGYVLATRRDDVSALVADIPGDIAVDVYTEPSDIQRKFPALDHAIANVIHVRRGGDISGQQLGQYFLGRLSGEKFERVAAEVVDIEQRGDSYQLTAASANQTVKLDAAVVVNAAGPFTKHVAAMLEVDLPLKNIYQQKIAFEDTLNAIPRDMPFSIDLDPKTLAWTDEEKAWLSSEPELAWLAKQLPSGSHCRPDGGAGGQWVKLGWAYNEKLSEAQEDLANEPAIDAQFPEIVIRGAAQFIPSLRPYVESPPTRFSHYGGYYTMTEENWPLIGPLNRDGAFVVGALSGFGSMSACAAGKLCAAHIVGANLPAFAKDLSLDRLSNTVLLESLRNDPNKGLL